MKRSRTSRSLWAALARCSQLINRRREALAVDDTDDDDNGGDGDNDHDLKTTTTLLNSGLSLRSIYFTVLDEYIPGVNVRAKCIYRRILPIMARPLCSRILTK
jgi:hypothetical protein